MDLLLIAKKENYNFYHFTMNFGLKSFEKKSILEFDLSSPNFQKRRLKLFELSLRSSNSSKLKNGLCLLSEKEKSGFGLESDVPNEYTIRTYWIQYNSIV